LVEGFRVIHKVPQTVGIGPPQFQENWGQNEEDKTGDKTGKRRGQNWFSNLIWSSREFCPQF